MPQAFDKISTTKNKKKIKAYFKDTRYQILERLAKNPNISMKKLKKLAKNTWWMVRVGVVQNLAATPQMILQLSGDKNYLVREAVGKGHWLDKKILRRLSHDQSKQVRMAVYANTFFTGTPPDNDATAKQGRLCHPACSLETIYLYAKDCSSEVRSMVVSQHINRLPIEQQKLLMHDKNEHVAAAVATYCNTLIVLDAIMCEKRPLSMAWIAGNPAVTNDMLYNLYLEACEELLSTAQGQPLSVVYWESAKWIQDYLGNLECRLSTKKLQTIEHRLMAQHIRDIVHPNRCADNCNCESCLGP